VLGLGFFAAGAYFAAPHVLDTANSQPVAAEIVSSDWGTYSTTEGQTRAYVDVTYRYTYEGEEYTGDTVFPGGRNQLPSGHRAEQIARNYSAGSTATVHVVAGGDTYLIETAMPWWYYLIPGFGALIAILGAWNLVRWLLGAEPAWKPD